MNHIKYHDWDIEELSAKLHDIYQAEAHRQEALGLGPARHYDEYEMLPESVQEFDRVLARFIIGLLTTQRQEFDRALNNGRIMYSMGKKDSYQDVLTHWEVTQVNIDALSKFNQWLKERAK